MEHMKFMMKVYEYQVSKGRVLLHEHPARAKSWMIKVVKRLAKRKRS